MVLAGEVLVPRVTYLATVDPTHIMRASTILTALCLLGGGAAKRVYRRDNATTADTLIPNRFILQFSDVSIPRICTANTIPTTD